MSSEEAKAPAPPAEKPAEEQASQESPAEEKSSPSSQPGRTAPRKPGEVDVTPGPQTAFLGGIPARATQSGLQKFLEEKFGPIEALRIITDKNTGRSKGYAFAQFKDEKDAAECKAAGMLHFLDKNINVGEAFKGTSKAPRAQKSNRNANQQSEYYGQDYSGGMPQLAHMAPSGAFNPYQLSAFAQNPAQLQMQAAAAMYYGGMGGMGYSNPYAAMPTPNSAYLQGLLQGQVAQAQGPMMNPADLQAVQLQLAQLQQTQQAPGGQAGGAGASSGQE